MVDVGSYLLSDGQFTEERSASACLTHIYPPLAYDLIAGPHFDSAQHMRKLTPKWTWV